MTVTSLDFAVIGLAVLCTTIVYVKTRPRKLPLPPGPPRLPIIGSLFEVPAEGLNWKWLLELSKKSGSDVIHFDVVGSHTVVLNSREAVTEIMERRAGLYSDRPHTVMVSELAGWDQTLGMSDYPRAKEMRRWLLKSMNSQAMQEWGPQLEEEALRYLQKCIRAPERFKEHIKHTAGATAVRLTYGYHPKDEHDELIETAQRGMDSFSEATASGAFAVDMLPILKYYPWAGFQRKAAMWREEIDAVKDAGMDHVQEQTRKGKAEPSFVSWWLDSAGPQEDTSIIPFTAASLFAAASDTTVSAVSTFFLAMLHYPDIQRKAQAEIDRVIGTDKLPTLSDRDMLPYVEGLYKEIYRWNPVTPFGIPHRYSGKTDDEYNGMRIPVGSTVLANMHAFMHDPEVHKNPSVFNPERFTGPVSEPNPEDTTFGYGRRRCPGILVAQTSIWLSVALTLATFNIEPYIGEDGKPEIPSLEYTELTIRHPKPFRCKITPRSEKIRKMVEGVAV